MVGAGEVITQRLAGVFPKENSAGIPDLVITEKGSFVRISRCSEAISLAVSTASSKS